eukprot:TRINITY_DN1295_c0_g1_i1.p2 TRINITY_DN1295_c0_g1~~TRINITY_DN1295_c0_g1_i1.p2  ORF type:complete len:321 (-),score=32.29 TRINITY_DN1295_c0_g1_i1:305-1267(-)
MNSKVSSVINLNHKYLPLLSGKSTVVRTPTLHKLNTRRVSGAVITRVSEQESKSEAAIDDCAYNVGEYCSIDEKAKRVDSLTLGEKEAQFIGALQSYYYEGTSSLTDEEFENLKEELIWSGSKIAVLSSKEQRFLEASQAYQAGKPIMSDAEFDKLKMELKQEESFVTQQGPRCSIRTGKMYSDCYPDYTRLLVLNIPAVLLVLLVVFGIDDITGFEITKFVELPQPYGIVALWGVTLPLLYVFSASLTDVVFKDAMILKGPCPNCGTENLTYFGNIFTVQGNRTENVIKCSNCKKELKFSAMKREIEVLEESEQPVPAK